MDFAIAMGTHPVRCFSERQVEFAPPISRHFAKLFVIKFKAGPVAFGAGLFFHSTDSCKLISLQEANEF